MGDKLQFAQDSDNASEIESVLCHAAKLGLASNFPGLEPAKMRLNEVHAVHREASMAAKGASIHSLIEVLASAEALRVFASPEVEKAQKRLVELRQIQRSLYLALAGHSEEELKEVMRNCNELSGNFLEESRN